MGGEGQQAAQAPYSVGAVVRITGLSDHTLRAWERRYGAIEPARTSGGTRRYTQRDVERLLLLKRAVGAGHRIGAIARLDDDAIAALLEPSVEAGAVGIDAVLDAVERFDTRDVERRLALQFSALGPEEFVRRVALPMLRAIGDRWERGEMAPAAEHLASGITRSLLTLALRDRPPPTRGSTLLLATPAGERHEFGLLVAALLASAEGYEIVYLGPDLPAEEIGRAAERSRADVVVLAVAGLARAAVARELAAVRASTPISTEIWIGGADPLLPGEGEGTTTLSSFEELRSRLRARPGGRLRKV